MIFDGNMFVLEFQALVFIHRFFSLSLVVFFFLWYTSTNGSTASNAKVRILSFSMRKRTWIAVGMIFGILLDMISIVSPLGIQVSSANSLALGHDQNLDGDHANVMHSGWDNHSWYYICVRMGLYLWV